MSGRPIHAVAAIFCVILAFAAGCARKSRAHVPAAPAAPAKIGSTETGIASWYGHPYHGRRAASGEIYDMEQFTAAHRTLPFNTWLEVTNLQNRKVVDVRINDRGPFVDGRIIDLSLAAARAIDMVGPGTARVRLKVIAAPSPIESAKVAAQNANASPPPQTSPPPPAPRRIPGPASPLVVATPSGISPAPAVESYAVRAGSFTYREDAESFQATIRASFDETRVVLIDSVWQVLVGRQLTLDAANRLAGKVLEVAGQAIIVRDR